MNSSVVISFYVKLFNLSVNFQAVEEKHLHCEIHTWMNLAGLDTKHLVYMPIGHMVLKFTCPAKILTCPDNICTSPVKLIYIAEKISTCPDWKITCPVGHVTTKVYVPWDKIYMPRAHGYALMLTPVWYWNFYPKIFNDIALWWDPLDAPFTGID